MVRRGPCRRGTDAWTRCVSRAVTCARVWSLIQADRRANPGNPKATLVLALFRLAQAARGDAASPRPASVPVGVLYRVLVDWVMGIELPWRTVVGAGLTLDHGHALVVHDHSVIGCGVTLRHSVTIGRRRSAGDC